MATAQSPSPRPDAVHITLHGFATRSKRVAEQLKAFAEMIGVKASVSEIDKDWVRVRAYNITGMEALQLAKEFGKRYGVQVWFWTSLVYDPHDNGPDGSSPAAQVVASAEA